MRASFVVIISCKLKKLNMELGGIDNRGKIYVPVIGNMAIETNELEKRNIK